jgi:hypothetical protein
MKLLFYNKNEYLAFRQDAKKMVHRMAMSMNVEDINNTCTHGLECKTAQGKTMKAFLRAKGQIAVFVEQNTQKEVGEFDPDMISCVCRDFTR